MRRFRSILLSGLVALLMVGMVWADTPTVPGSGFSPNTPIEAFIGYWDGSSCTDTDAMACVKFGVAIPIDEFLDWLKNLIF